MKCARAGHSDMALQVNNSVHQGFSIHTHMHSHDQIM